MFRKILFTTEYACNEYTEVHLMYPQVLFWTKLYKKKILLRSNSKQMSPFKTPHTFICSVTAKTFVWISFPPTFFFCFKIMTF